jgi:aquaporin Z
LITWERKMPANNAAAAAEFPFGKRLAAEFFGTFWLVLGGCGSAVLSAAFPEVGIGFLGVALAFGLAVLTAAYAVGHISGGHFNPAVSLGLAVGGRFGWTALLPYWIVQVLAAIAAATVLYFIAIGQAGVEDVGKFASNGYGDASPGNFGLAAVIITEVVLTAVFVMVILGVTGPRAPAGFAPLAIGLTLTLIHLISIPVTNASVNPARSTGPALFADAPALAQLWAFWVTPLAGAVLGGLLWRLLLSSRDR